MKKGKLTPQERLARRCARAARKLTRRQRQQQERERRVRAWLADVGPGANGWEMLIYAVEIPVVEELAVTRLPRVSGTLPR